jgi:uncharacterized protein YceH (UPF0502 family)
MQMSAEAVDPATWPVLGLVERRLLGVLVEKAKTTPDAYPLSINALATGSNQKSNREPVLNLTEDDVEEGLRKLQQLGLATRITGGRVERWRHNLYEVLHVDKIELAILAELLLRGPQTEGELRSHANRMEPLADLDALRPKVRGLQARRLVSWLGEEGRRGALIAHGFHDPAELEALRGRAAAAEASGPLPIAAPPVAPGELVALREQVSGLEERVRTLQDRVDQLERGLQALRESLGA